MGKKGKLLFEGIAGGVPGIAIGKVRITNGDEVKLGKLEPGEILVGTKFEPDHDPYLHKALAIIQNVGGPTAHVNIFATTFGKIAVTGTVGMDVPVEANRLLHDGQVVLVEGYSSTVTVTKPDGTKYQKKLGAVYEYLPDLGEVIPSVKTEVKVPPATCPPEQKPVTPGGKFDMSSFLKKYGDRLESRE